MISRREEVGTASEQKADEGEGGLSAALLYSQTESEIPIYNRGPLLGVARELCVEDIDTNYS